MRFTKWAVAAVAAGSLLFVGFSPASAGDRDEHEPCPTDETVDDGEVHATSDRDGKNDRKKDECPPEEEPPEEEPPEEEPEPQPAVAVVVEPVFTG